MEVKDLPPSDSGAFDLTRFCAAAFTCNGDLTFVGLFAASVAFKYYFVIKIILKDKL